MGVQLAAVGATETGEGVSSPRLAAWRGSRSVALEERGAELILRPCTLVLPEGELPALAGADDAAPARRALARLQQTALPGGAPDRGGAISATATYGSQTGRCVPHSDNAAAVAATEFERQVGAAPGSICSERRRHSSE